jgi:type IV pilus assembly protein PilA
VIEQPSTSGGHVPRSDDGVRSEGCKRSWPERHGPVQVDSKLTTSLEEDPTVLNRLRNNRLRGEEGFTLIELLVVILIIGILAAIAIPSFLNQKGKGEDSKAKADARTTQTAMETWYTDNQNYRCGPAANADSGVCVTNLKAIEAQVPDNGGAANQVTVTPGDSGYTIAVVSPGGRTFNIVKAAGGGVTRTCSRAAVTVNAGGCKFADPAADLTGTW